MSREDMIAMRDDSGVGSPSRAAIGRHRAQSPGIGQPHDIEVGAEEVESRAQELHEEANLPSARQPALVSSGHRSSHRSGHRSGRQGRL